MIVFYSQNINAGWGELSSEDSKHCYKVLRKKVGDKITVLDGKGGRHLCRINEIEKSKVTFAIEKSSNEEKALSHPHIGISLLKNTSRLEWFLEKATEIGISSVQPLECSRTLKGKFRIDRAEAIVTSAMKQSMRSYLPEVKELEKLVNVLTAPKTIDRYICHYDPENPHLYDVLEPGKPCFILIGPEGDFTDEEMTIAKENHWISVNISASRLRTETAGISAAQIIALKNR